MTKARIDPRTTKLRSMETYETWLDEQISDEQAHVTELEGQHNVALVRLETLRQCKAHLVATRTTGKLAGFIEMPKAEVSA